LRIRVFSTLADTFTLFAGNDKQSKCCQKLRFNQNTQSFEEEYGDRMLVIEFSRKTDFFVKRLIK